MLEKHVVHNAQIGPFLRNYMENRSKAHHCPQKSKSIYFSCQLILETLEAESHYSCDIQQFCTAQWY